MGIPLSWINRADQEHSTPRNLFPSQFVDLQEGLNP
jgi:hypothetical protein